MLCYVFVHSQISTLHFGFKSILLCNPCLPNICFNCHFETYVLIWMVENWITCSFECPALMRMEKRERAGLLNKYLKSAEDSLCG